MRKQEKKSQVYRIVKEHIYHNLKQYMIVSIFFLVGIVLGILFVNHATSETQEQIGNTITTFLDALKGDYQIDTGNLFRSVVANRVLFAFLLWFMGCTLIGIPVVYGMVIAKGFSLGYTISSILYTLGTTKGIFFCLLTLLLQNILYIPCTLALAVSGVKLYGAIMRDKRRENIKIEIVRHTIFSLFLLCIFLIAAVLEVYVSNSLLSFCIGYF